MATYLPPSENLPIFDTSVFDETNGAYLTYTTAKKLFLTYPTAQGEETIASLIAGSIDYSSPVSGSVFEIGTNQVSGGTVRIGPTGTSGVSVHAGNIDCTNNTINNATDAALNNLSLGNSQTSGVLNIGTGTRVTSGNGGAINIGTGGSVTAPINIGGGASSTNTINIGQTGTTTGTTTINLNTSTVGSHPINIGSSTATTFIKGPSTCTGLITASAGVSATGSVSASTSVLTPTLTTSSGVPLNIGTTTATSVNVGSSSITTSIPGILSTSVGTLSGKTAYFAVDTLVLQTATVTLDPTTLNFNSAMYFYGAAVPSFNYIIATGGVNGQTISFKHVGSQTITLQFANNIVLNTALTGTLTTTLTGGSTLSVIYSTANGWMQTNATASLALTSSLSSPTVSASTSLTTPLLTSTAGLSVGTSGSTSVTIGSSGIGTIINGLLTYGGFLVSGGVDYVNNTAASYTVPTNANREFFLIANVGTSSVTFPSSTTAVIGQIINLRVQSGSSVTVTSTGCTFFPNNGTVAGSTSPVTLPSGSVSRFYFISGNYWIGF